MVKTCPICLKRFIPSKFANKRQIYCSIYCRSRAYYEVYYQHFKWKTERICTVCKAKFLPKNENQLQCSSKCTKKKYKIIHRDKWLKSQQIYNAKRKLIKEKHQQDIKCRKLWRQNNKDKTYSYKRARRARKYGNGGRHTKAQWEALKIKFDYTCQHCFKKEPEIRLTEDHVIPLSKGGTDDIENIQPLCFICNCTKNNKLTS